MWQEGPQLWRRGTQAFLGNQPWSLLSSLQAHPHCPGPAGSAMRSLPPAFRHTEHQVLFHRSPLGP